MVGIDFNKLSQTKNPYGELLTHSVIDITKEIEDYCCTETVIAIGASTGGIKAIITVLAHLPTQMPPILIVQHMPKTYTEALAKRLDQLCPLTVTEARHGDILESGHVYLAPGDMHMTVIKKHRQLYVSLHDGPLVCYQKPSVEVLFNSMADVVKDKGVGVILTGMGNDGAAGLKNMKDSGAYTIAQDEATSTVFGMPCRAIALGGVSQTLPIQNIAGVILGKLQKTNRLKLRQQAN